jgi:hypothetical protein
MRHELKTWPGGFEAIIRGEKSHEIRPADRDFKVGDQLFLREWAPDHLHGCEWETDGRCRLCRRAIGEPMRGDYTGREALVDVTYITPEGRFGCPMGYVVMSVSLNWRTKPDGQVQNETARG